MTTYRIRDWANHFENNRTRELKELRFVIMPNKQDGDGYTELLDHPNGAAHYGAWCSLVQVASKGQHPAGGCGIPAGCCECRGILLRDGARPHDPSSLSRVTRIPAAIFQEVLPRLVTIGWLEAEQTQVQQNQVDRVIPQEAITIPHPPAEKCDSLKNGMEGNGIEQKGIKRGRGDKPRDPRFNHPAIRAFYEVKGKYPHKDVWDLVIEKVGTHPDVPKMRECWLAWRSHAHNPEDLVWVLDWYFNGIPEHKQIGGRNGTNQPGPTTASAKNLKGNVEYLRSIPEDSRATDSETPTRLLTTKPGHSRISGSG